MREFKCKVIVVVVTTGGPFVASRVIYLPHPPHRGWVLNVSPARLLVDSVEYDYQAAKYTICLKQMVSAETAGEFYQLIDSFKNSGWEVTFGD